MYAAVTVAACQRDACQHQGYTSEHYGGDALAENQDAEHDRNDGQQVGGCRSEGHALRMTVFRILRCLQPQPLAWLSVSRRAGSRTVPGPPARSRAARLPLLQDGELVAQDQDHGGLLRLLTPGQLQPRGRSRYQEEHEPQGHDR
jgi:hypothetical protein